jgi:hypothetical protein
LDKKKWCPALSTFFRNGERIPIDGAIGYLCNWPGPVSESDLWQAALGYASIVKKRWVGKIEGQAPTTIRWYTKGGHATLRRVTEEASQHSLVCALWQIGDCETRAEQVAASILMTRGPMRIAKLAADSVVISASDVTVDGGSGLLVLSNGRVTLRGSYRYTTVLAREGIDAAGARFQNCYLGSPGSVVFETRHGPPGVHIISESTDPMVREMWSRASLLGLEFKTQGDKLAVTAVRANSVASKAGLRNGDYIGLVGGQEPKTETDLMRGYWRAAPQGSCRVRVRRSNSTVDLELAVPPP